MSKKTRNEKVESNTVNQEVIDEQTGKPELVNDLSMGKYDVVTETGPAFATQRQESAQQIMELMTNSPEIASLALDLVAKDLPILETKELTKRVRKQYIQQGIVEPTEEEIEEYGLNQPQAPDPQQEAITTNIAMQTEKLISDIEGNDAKTAETMVKAQGELIDTYAKLLDTYKTQQELGIPLSPADRAIIIKQRDIVAEGQQVLDEGPNSEQAASIIQDAVQQEQQVETQQREHLKQVLTVQQP